MGAALLAKGGAGRFSTPIQPSDPDAQRLAWTAVAAEIAASVELFNCDGARDPWLI
jgi:hypothetical protein